MTNKILIGVIVLSMLLGCIIPATVKNSAQAFPEASNLRFVAQNDYFRVFELRDNRSNSGQIETRYIVVGINEYKHVGISQ
jgi:hypothetical protein